MRSAAFMGIPNGNYWPYNPDVAAGILLMARGTAQGLSGLGWSKDAVKAYLWENSKVQRRSTRRSATEGPVPIVMSPRGIKIVIAGGAQSGHMMWLQVGASPEQLTSAGIKLPANWDELLKKGEEDLGPLPAN